MKRSVLIQMLHDATGARRVRAVLYSLLPVAAVFWFSGVVHAAEAARVIQLTQVPCQFLESEGGINRGYKSRSISDCEAINAMTGEQRVAEAKLLQLKPGRCHQQECALRAGLLAARRLDREPRYPAQRIRRRDPDRAVARLRDRAQAR
jgi:hypothetical protein